MSIGEGRKVTIVGAGLAGALLACYLAKLGFRVNVYERRGDPRRAGYSGGRSINLALSARGLWGLQGIGLDQEILRHALPMRGRMMHAADPETPLAFQPYSKNPTDAINSISRGGLNMALLDAAEKFDNVELFFNQRCLDVDIDKPAATFQDESEPAQSGRIGTVESDLIIGADGAFSAVRGRMQKIDRFEYQQTYLAHGYKELHIPAVDGGPGAKFGGYAMDPTALHIWPRGSSMMIALPNPDKTFTCTLFWPFEGSPDESAFGNLRTEAEVVQFFRRVYPDVPQMMPTLAQDYLQNPSSSLVTVRCWPWVYAAKASGNGRCVALIGDAAHAIVPFFGQGMNAAFEDVRVLAECIERSRGDLPRALDEYQRLRKPNADAIAQMALENFVEMRDKVGSRLFRFRKHAEHFLHDLMPRTLIPRYNLVSFSTVPYAEAQRQGEFMDRIIRAIGVLLLLVMIFGLATWLRWSLWLLVVAAVVGGWLLWEWERSRGRSQGAEAGVPRAGPGPDAGGAG